MRLSGIALSALVLACLPVQAADLGWGGNTSSPIYSPTSATQWTGFYAGISGGYGWGTTVNSPALPGGAIQPAASLRRPFPGPPRPDTRHKHSYTVGIGYFS